MINEAQLGSIGLVPSAVRQERFSSALRHLTNLTASISPIQRPFHPDTGKDFGSIWSRQSDQLTPVTRKLAKPNALMFFHMPLYD